MSWEENVRRVEPYVAGEQPRKPGIIKLNTNENPYPPSPKVEEAAGRMETEKLRLYPDMNAEKLVNALADTYKVKPEQIFVGVGSDDVLAMAFMTFFNGKSTSCSRISPIPFMMSGQRFSGFLTKPAPLMRISVSGGKTTFRRTEAL